MYFRALISLSFCFPLPSVLSPPFNLFLPFPYRARAQHQWVHACMPQVEKGGVLRQGLPDPGPDRVDHRRRHRCRVDHRRLGYCVIIVGCVPLLCRFIFCQVRFGVYPVQVQRSLRVQMEWHYGGCRHVHIQVSTFSSRSDGLAAVVQLCRGGERRPGMGCLCVPPSRLPPPLQPRPAALRFTRLPPSSGVRRGGDKSLRINRASVLFHKGGF